MISNKNAKFGLISEFLTIEQRFWPMFLASFLRDRALVGIFRWHGRLCLPTVVSGSIAGPIY